MALGGEGGHGLDPLLTMQYDCFGLEYASVIQNRVVSKGQVCQWLTILNRPYKGVLNKIIYYFL